MDRRWVQVVALGCAVAALAVPEPASAAPPQRPVTVVRWVDGDTVETSAGVVRLIGVDAPEVGTCGARAATRVARRAAPPGSRIRLREPRSVRDRDRYGRLLRYVEAGRVDVGLRLVRAGAQARYDSRDGYDPHPREARYRAADAAHPDLCPPPPGDLTHYAPVPGTSDCPAGAPIKGNQGEDEWIYHLPTQRYYAVTDPEECFASEAGAQAAGYRRARV